MTPESRKKKLLYHSRRGMWELDKMLIPFIDSQFESLSEAQLVLLEELLEESDPNLFLWLIQKDQADSQYKELVALIIANARA